MAYRATSIRNEHPGAVAAPRGRLFQWLEHFPFKRSSSEEEPAEPEAEIARRYDRAENRRAKLYQEIGEFLFAHDLDLTPLNFGLAHDYVTGNRSEEHTSELQSLMRISYAVLCLKKKIIKNATHTT